MSLVLEKKPSEEPVTVSDVKSFLKIDTSDDDALLTTLIASARLQAEQYTSLAFITQTWSLWLDRILIRKAIEIPMAPVIAIAAISAFDGQGNETEISAASYEASVEDGRGRIYFKETLCDKVQTFRGYNALKIVFSVGFGAADGVPAPIRYAIMCFVADAYCHRGDDASAFDLRAKNFLQPFKRIKI